MLVSTRMMILLVAIILASCSSIDPESRIEQDPHHITYGLTLSVSGIDPHINRSNELGIVLRQVYDTLVYRDPETQEFVAGLASSWEISEDGLTYTFSLRSDVTFHDGTPFDAEAVAINFQRILAPETASQKARFLLGPIVSYQVMDTHSFRITLSEPFEPLLDSLSQVYLGIASPTALAAYANEPLRYQFHQVGTGPFRFVEYIPEDRIVIQRNPDYAWGPAFYLAELPDNAISGVTFRFFRDPATRLIALESGTVDVIGELLPTDAESIAASNEFVLNPVTIPGEPLQFFINTQLEPTNDLAVRQALIYAVNRVSIVDAVYGGFSPVAWGPVSANTLFYNRGVQNVYAYNVEQAQALLNQAGYTDTDNDGILERAGTPLRITILQPPWGLVPQVALFLQDQWRTIGIDTVIKPVAGFAALLDEVAQGEYHLVAFDQSGLDPYILNQAYLSMSPDNWTQFSSEGLDEILLQATRTRDPEERRLLYGQAQAIILEQALILPVRDYVNLNGHTTSIEGLRYDAYGWFPILHGVSIR